MQRRHFLSQTAMQLGGLSIAPSVLAMGQDRENKDYGTSAISPTVVDRIGKNSLKKLRNFHQKELDNEYLGFWDNNGIDWEYGGFYTYHDNDFEPDSSDKEMYYIGRGIWVFSYLYNHFGGNKKHLKAVELAIDFIEKYGRDKNSYWNSEFTREGEVTLGSFNIYGDMYVALGLGEYYYGTGDEKARDTAIETCHKVTERIVSPAYQHLAGHGGGHEPGTKRLGTWQHYLSVLTPLARYTNDFSIEMMARMCVRNILERHYRPELGIAFEHLDDQFQPFRPDPNDNHRAISGWHSIQAAWMCMEEALRVNDKAMFMTAMEMGRLALEKCWVDGDHGGLVSISNPQAKPVEPESDAPSGAMDDALIFTLLAIEHTHAPWAIHWFDKVFTHGYTKPDRWKRPGLLHHPRRLFFCIDILDRMISRKGRVSDFIDS